MGAEHSQQRVEADGHEIYEGRSIARLASIHNNEQNNSSSGIIIGNGENGSAALSAVAAAAATAATNKRRNAGRLNGGVAAATAAAANTNGNTSVVIPSKQIISDTSSPTSSEFNRAPSPPLSVCSDLPYVSYMDRPIGDSPKIRNKPASAFQQGTSRAAARKSYPSGIKPKRPQTTASSHSIVIVKPGARDMDYDIDPDLLRLRNIPQFLPVLRESITSATFTRDTEILERLHSHHLLNICSRMQTHLNLCATHITSEQNHLVERTKVVSNSITTLFASFVDMQKTYAAYAEQFAKIRVVSQQLSRCNSLLHENIASLEKINNFLDQEDRLEPFIWRTDDNKLRGEAEGAVVGSNSGRLWRM